MSASFQAWLQQVTLPYVNGNHVAIEVDSALRIFHSLRPQSSIYTLSDGYQQNLLNLVGTLSVISQQNQRRNIEVPVEICLPLNYPMEMPIIWVRPMVGGSVILRPTDNVDGNGMVWGLEGLKNLSLVDLILQLQDQFGDQLPIISEDQDYLGNTRSSTSDRVRNQTVFTHPTTAYTTTAQTTAVRSSNANLQILKEKVLSEIEGKAASFRGEIERIQKLNSTFVEGENVLKREKLVLNNEINLLLKEIDCLESKRTEQERFITNNSSTIDRSATVPIDPASSQLLELLANESALMDTLYSLIKTTVTPGNEDDIRLPLPAALRGIRELSRKHFLTKAHIRKATSSN